MQTLVNDIRDRISSLNLFKYIDEDWGQLDDYSTNPPTKWPCALVDIVEAKPGNLGGLIQVVDITIMVRVAALRLSPGSQKATEAQRLHSEEVFGLCTTVHSKLHGWHSKEDGTNYGTLTRTGLRRNKRDDGIREYQLLFTTALKDSSAQLAVTDLHAQVPSVIKPDVSLGSI